MKENEISRSLAGGESGDDVSGWPNSIGGDYPPIMLL